MIKLSGYSDDNVEIEGDYEDEILAYDRESTDFVIGTPEGGVRVGMAYSDLGVWMATLSPLKEGVPIPWPVRIEAGGYTIVAIVDCPPGTPVQAWQGQDELVWENGEPVGEE